MSTPHPPGRGPVSESGSAPGENTERANTTSAENTGAGESRRKPVPLQPTGQQKPREGSDRPQQPPGAQQAAKQDPPSSGRGPVPPWQRGQANPAGGRPPGQTAPSKGQPPAGTKPPAGRPDAARPTRQWVTGNAVKNWNSESQSPQGEASKAAAPKPEVSKNQPPAQGAPAAKARPEGTRSPSAGAQSPASQPAAKTPSGARITRDNPKAATLDAPTHNIDRKNVPKHEMPDLSAVRHPQTSSVAVAEPVTEEAPRKPRPAVTVGNRRGRGPLRAAMQLRKVDPWSTLKVSLMLSVAMFFVWMVAVAILYLVLDGMGVWDRLNTGVTDIMANSDASSTLIGPGQVFGVAAIIGIVNIVLFTALATVGAFMYNLVSDTVGGVEVTLADRD